MEHLGTPAHAELVHLIVSRQQESPTWRDLMLALPLGGKDGWWLGSKLLATVGIWLGSLLGVSLGFNLLGGVLGCELG